MKFWRCCIRRLDGGTDQPIARRRLDRDRLRNSQRRRNRSQNQRNATSRAWKINVAFLARFVIDPALIQFAQAPESCQKRGKVGGVKQRLLAELDAFEITSFDRCVQRRAPILSKSSVSSTAYATFVRPKALGSIGSTLVFLSLSIPDTALFVEARSCDLR